MKPSASSASIQSVGGRANLSRIWQSSHVLDATRHSAPTAIMQVGAGLRTTRLDVLGIAITSRRWRGTTDLEGPASSLGLPAGPSSGSAEIRGKGGWGPGDLIGQTSGINGGTGAP